VSAQPVLQIAATTVKGMENDYTARRVRERGENNRGDINGYLVKALPPAGRR